MKILNKALIITILCAFTSCEKFLDTKPYDFVEPSQYYKTESDLNIGLNGIYATLKADWTYADNMISKMGLEADEGFMGNAGLLTSVAGYSVSSGDTYIRDYWQAFYTGIFRANLLLEHIDQSEVSENIKNKIKGEALFLRGYYYFMLVRAFGDVPLILVTAKSPSVEDTQIPRTNYKKVYEQILLDMETAAGMVSDIASIGHGGRVSKSAVWGILARVNLAMAGRPLNDKSRFQEAKKCAEKVIDLGYHELNKDFRQVFINYAQDKYDPKETIWEVEFWGNNSAGIFTSGGKVAINNGIEYKGTLFPKDDPIIPANTGYLRATPVLYERYTPVVSAYGYSYDMRRDWTIAPFYYEWSASKNIVDSIYRNANNRFHRNSGKWRRNYEVVRPRLSARTSQNFPLLRYSDVLLMYAEAENEINGPTPRSIEYINHIRRRGYGKYLNGIGNKSESIKSVRVDNGGSNYVANVSGSAALSLFVGGGGQEAAGWFSISSQKVTKLTITNAGWGYHSAPALSVTYSGGGTGSGAVFTIELTDIKDADAPTVNTSSQSNFRNFIKEERSRELAFELHRKWDLIRWGNLDEKMIEVKNYAAGQKSDTFRTNALTNYSNYSARDTIWPIPAYERGVNGKLTQNGDW
jgi:hypothetical protein